MKLDFKKFKKVSSNATRTTFKHPDGHFINVAHAALTPKTLSQMQSLKSYADGGEIELDDKDTKVPEANPEKAKQMQKGAMSGATSPAEAWGNLKKGMGFDEGGSVAQSNPRLEESKQHPPKANYAEGGEAEAMPGVGEPGNGPLVQDVASLMGDSPVQPAIIPPSTDPQLISQPQMAQRMPSQEAMAAPQEPTAQAAAPQVQAAVSKTSDPAGMITGGFNQEMQGIREKAAADTQQGEIEQAIDAKRAEDVRKQIDNVRDTTNEGIKERELFIKNIKDGHINAEKYWDDHSKLMAGIGVILGGFGPPGTNMALDFINRNIDRNIAAQQANLNSNHNLLAANLHTYGNMRDAQAMTRVMYNDMAVNALHQAAAMSRGPQAKAIADMQAGALQRQAAPEFMNFAMRQALIKAGQQEGSPTGDQTEAMLPYLRVVNPAAAKEIEARHIPGVGTASIPVPEKAREELQSRQSLQDQVHNLRNWAASHSGSLSPIDIAYGKALANTVQDQYRRANGQGVFREAEADFVKGIVAEDPTAFFNKLRVDPKYKALEDSNAMTLNGLRKSYGLPPVNPMAQLNAQQKAFAQHAQGVLKSDPNNAQAIAVLKKLGMQ